MTTLPVSSRYSILMEKTETESSRVDKKDQITFEKGDGELVRVQIADIFSQVCV